MPAKDLLRDLAPPLLWRMAQRWRRGQRVAEPPPEWEYVPEGWAYAATHPDVRGWDVPDIAAVYRRKWPRFLALAAGAGPLGIAHESALTTNSDLISHNEVMAFGYVLAVAARGHLGISLLDWGGGSGHYYLLARALWPELAFDYHCKDVPALATLGAELLPEAHFYADESCLGRDYDLVMASTSLHYAEDWQRVLGGLAGASRRYLYVTGLPLVEEAPSFVFLQRPYAYGYNTEYLGWCLNRREFQDCVRRAGFELAREFVVGLRQPIQGAPASGEYRGFLFRRTEIAHD